MDLYIDKENLFSFVSQKNEEDYVDCSRLMRRQLHIIYGFEKTDVCDWDENIRLCFLNDMADGRGWKEESDLFDPKYLEINESPIGFIVFLLNDTHRSSLSNNNKLLGCVGEEIATIKKLFCGSDYDLHQLYNIQDKSSLPSWEKLKQDGHNLPCTDIIIFDRYLFENDYGVIKTNLHKLLLLLTESDSDPCNIVIITLGNTTTLWRRCLMDIKSIHHDNVTIAFSPPLKKKGEKPKISLPHDRTILTNYRLFRSGDSFCYFDSKDNVITKGKSLDVDSLAKSDTQCFADTFIKEMQKVCDEINKMDLPFSPCIIGDKISNMIRF